MSIIRNFKRMAIEEIDNYVQLNMGEMDIWDGADLALLREGLSILIEREKCRAIVIDMQHVKYIPSGFFGMLFDWHEKRNVWFALTPPQPNVGRMLWFQQFFRPQKDGLYELVPEGIANFSHFGDISTPAANLDRPIQQHMNSALGD